MSKVTATGSDYDMASSTLEFPIGTTNGTMMCTSVAITDDEVFEGNENFTVGITLNNRVMEEENTIITILDNDSMFIWSLFDFQLI